MLERITHRMEGTYKYDDCIVVDPVVTIYNIGRDMGIQTVAEINWTDPLDSANGCSFTIEDPSEPTEWTEDECQVWVEQQCQQYRI